MAMKLIFVISFSLLSPTLSAEELKPFSTDGCSMFPDGTAYEKTLWRDCCVVHDWSYWQGGTYQQRAAADEALAECVAQLGEKDISELMHTGVAIGGTPYLPSEFRWGYGWSQGRGYQALTDEESEQVKQYFPLNGLK